jgi:hypothetical protein
LTVCAGGCSHFSRKTGKSESYIGNVSLIVLQAVLNDLRSAQPVFGNDGRLAKLVSEIDRGPLMAWMMVADHSKISVLR